MANLLDLCKFLVDDHVGIIKHLQEDKPEAGAPDFVYYMAQTCSTKALNPEHDQGSVWASGASTDRAMAKAKAVGEAIERYCAAIYRIDELPLASFDSAPFPCVRPQEFALFSTKQHSQIGFPYRPFGTQLQVRWVPASDLYTKETTYVPAAQVFLPYLCKKERGEQPFTPQISTGLACHTDSTLAAVSGICEVIERDAFAITWQAQLSRAKIRLDTLSPRNIDLLARLRRPEATVILLHLAMDHEIPVILSAMRSTVADAPALIVAAAAHLDPEVAVQKSLDELAQLASFSQRVKSMRPTFSPGTRWERVDDPTSHASVYFEHTNAYLADFLFASKTQIDFSEIKNVSTQNPASDLRLLVDTIHASKHRVLIADVTTEDVRSFGIVVLRALIPGFHPLFMGHRFRALGGARLWEVPQKLGLRATSRRRIDNPFPHPFL